MPVDRVSLKAALGAFFALTLTISRGQASLAGPSACRDFFSSVKGKSSPGDLLKKNPSELALGDLLELSVSQPRDKGLSNAAIDEIHRLTTREIERRRGQTKFAAWKEISLGLKSAVKDSKRQAQQSLVDALVLDPDRLSPEALQSFADLKTDSFYLKGLNLSLLQSLAQKYYLRANYADLRLVQISAMAENWTIASNGKLPWSIPEDTHFYLDKIKGKIFVAGRLTYELTPAEEKWNTLVTIVITSDRAYRAAHANVVIAHSLDEALQTAARYRKNSHDEIFIGGGGTIYDQTLLATKEIYQTLIHRKYDGETVFPFIDEGQFKIASDIRKKDGKNDYSFRHLIRRN